VAGELTRLWLVASRAAFYFACKLSAVLATMRQSEREKGVRPARVRGGHLRPPLGPVSRDRPR
jgi:hypothetical protein